jgi:hypothetical protein
VQPATNNAATTTIRFIAHLQRGNKHLSPHQFKTSETPMPRDGSGNYSLPAGYYVNLGDDVLPSQHNPPLEDVAQGLTGSLARSGAGGMLGSLSMGGFSLTNVAALSGDVIMATGDLREGTSGKLVTTAKIWDDAGSVDLGNLTGTEAIDFDTFLGLAHGVATGNITLGAVSNGKPGQTVIFDISQDETGGRTLAYDDTYWIASGGEITWDETADARNILVATVLHDGKVFIASTTSDAGAE